MLGLKGEKDIDVQTLKFQTIELTKNPENAQIKEIEEMCRDIYRTLSMRLVEPVIKDYVLNQLSEMPCIVTEKTFVYPKQVIYSLKHDCSPFFYGLRPWCIEHFSMLMEKCGVRESFESADIINALSSIKQQHDRKQLSNDTLDLVSRITKLLNTASQYLLKIFFFQIQMDFFAM